MSISPRKYAERTAKTIAEKYEDVEVKISNTKNSIKLEVKNKTTNEFINHIFCLSPSDCNYKKANIQSLSKKLNKINIESNKQDFNISLFKRNT